MLLPIKNVKILLKLKLCKYISNVIPLQNDWYLSHDICLWLFRVNELHKFSCVACISTVNTQMKAKVCLKIVSFPKGHRTKSKHLRWSKAKLSLSHSFLAHGSPSLSFSATAQSVLDERVLKWKGAVDPGLTGVWDQETFCAVSVRETETDGEKRREDARRTHKKRRKRERTWNIQT